ncbi:MAG: hypothetical protein ACLTDR_09520 [Adlercreutzia equolifaciens]
MKLKTKRTIAAVGLLGSVGVGLAVHTGTGTPSAWGIGDIAAICPLGAVEAAIASLHHRAAAADRPGHQLRFSWPWRVSCLLRLGLSQCPCRAGSSGIKERRGRQINADRARRGQRLAATGCSGPRCSPRPPSGSRCSASSALVDLSSSHLHRPYGALLQFSEATLSLVVIPTSSLVAEIVLSRKWCHRFCPWAPCWASWRG